MDASQIKPGVKVKIVGSYGSGHGQPVGREFYISTNQQVGSSQINLTKLKQTIDKVCIYVYADEIELVCQQKQVPQKKILTGLYKLQADQRKQLARVNRAIAIAKKINIDPAIETNNNDLLKIADIQTVR
jgi:hypothetical protein